MERAYQFVARNTPAIAAALLAFSSGIAFAAMAMKPEAKQQCAYIAETYSGDVYVIGVGDTCRDAWRNHSPIPDDTREVRTEMTTAATRGVPLR